MLHRSNIATFLTLRKKAAKLFSAASIFSALCLSGLLTQAVCAREVILEDDSLRVAFDADSGALTRLENKTTHWVIERRPELGVSFRLFAPLPERRWNPVLGQKQTATVEKISEHEIHLQWKNLISENGGVLSLTLAADVTLTSGALTFSATLKNDSALTVETVDYPYFGDFNSSTRSTPLTLRVLTDKPSGEVKADELYPHFSNEKGYWGTFWPLKMREAPPAAFCLISAPDEGLTVKSAAPSAPYRLQYAFEQHPGLISSINTLVPAADNIAGTPVHLEFRACHFIFAAPHSVTNLAPVTVRCYSGDWHAGAECKQP
jgi:hypothetical protein